MATKRSSRRRSSRKHPKKSKSNWPVTYRFVAMGTLIAYTAFGAIRISLAGPALR
jgi:hypothetical protein